MKPGTIWFCEKIVSCWASKICGPDRLCETYL